MKVLAFAASLRKESWNHKLVVLASEIARREGAEVDLARFAEFGMPLYDGDDDRANGLPAGALALKRRLDAAQAVLIAAPEYNYSIAGPLKNAIDWVSRARPMPWRGKSVFLLSASPSAMGGIRGLWQTRIPLEGCGALVFPDMFALAKANEAFEATGQLRDRALAEKLDRDISGFVRLAEAVSAVCALAGAAPTSDAKARQEKIAEALEEESRIQPPSR